MKNWATRPLTSFTYTKALPIHESLSFTIESPCIAVNLRVGLPEDVKRRLWAGALFEKKKLYVYIYI